MKELNLQISLKDSSDGTFTSKAECSEGITGTEFCQLVGGAIATLRSICQQFEKTSKIYIWDKVLDLASTEPEIENGLMVIETKESER